MRVIPSGMAMPLIFPLWGSSKVLSMEAGEVKGTLSAMGRSDTPLFRGSTEPLATKDTSFSSFRICRSASWSSAR